MKEKKMTNAETSAWLVGQFQLASALVEDLRNGYDLDAKLNHYLKVIGDEARKNDQITLLFATMEVRQYLVEHVKKELAD